MMEEEPGTLIPAIPTALTSEQAESQGCRTHTAFPGMPVPCLVHPTTPRRLSLLQPINNFLNDLDMRPLNAPLQKRPYPLLGHGEAGRQRRRSCSVFLALIEDQEFQESYSNCQADFESSPAGGTHWDSAPSHEDCSGCRDQLAGHSPAHLQPLPTARGHVQLHPTPQSPWLLGRMQQKPLTRWQDHPGKRSLPESTINTQGRGRGTQRTLPIPFHGTQGD